MSDTTKTTKLDPNSPHAVLQVIVAMHNMVRDGITIVCDLLFFVCGLLFFIALILIITGVAICQHH